MTTAKQKILEAAVSEASADEIVAVLYKNRETGHDIPEQVLSLLLRNIMDASTMDGLLERIHSIALDKHNESISVDEGRYWLGVQDAMIAAIENI